MQAMGFEPEDYETDPIEVWPENWPVWSLFSSVSTQWRTGASGPIGLDYQPAFTLMDRLGLKGDDWWDTFHDLQHIEAQALARMKEQQP